MCITHELHKYLFIYGNQISILYRGSIFFGILSRFSFQSGTNEKKTIIAPPIFMTSGSIQFLNPTQYNYSCIIKLPQMMLLCTTIF